MLKRLSFTSSLGSQVFLHFAYPEGVATAAVWRGARWDKCQCLEQVQAKDFLGRALLSCHAAISLIRWVDKISAWGFRGLLIFFLQQDRVGEFGIFSARLVTSSEFGGVENVTQSYYKLSFSAGLGGSLFCPALRGPCPEHAGRLKNATVGRILQQSRPELAGPGLPSLTALPGAGFPASC